MFDQESKLLFHLFNKLAGRTLKTGWCFVLERNFTSQHSVLVFLNNRNVKYSLSWKFYQVKD